MARLGDLCRFINGDRGKNYPSQAEISSEGDVPFINAGHIVGGKLDFSDMNYISEEKYNQLNSGKVQENDILYCLRGSLGKKAIIKGVQKGAIASSLVIIRPDSRLLNSNFLFYALESPIVQEQMMQANNGSSQPNLSAKSVSDYNINLPSINDQFEIVSILAKVSELITLRKEQLTKLDELVKARFVEMFGDPVSNPMGWECKRFDSLCENLDYRRKPITASERESGIYPYYGASGIVDYVAGYLFDEDILLISEDGANLLMRSTPIAFSVSGKVWVNNHAHVLRFEKMCMQKYVEMYFSMIDISEFITGSAQPKLNQAKLNSMMIPVPDDDGMNSYLQFIQQTNKTKLTIQASLDKLEVMKKALMQEYFG